MEVNDGARSSQGRSGQEGQPKEGPGQEPVMCKICGNPEDNHPYRHMFTPEGTPIDTRQFDRKRFSTRPGGDDMSQGIPSAQGAAEQPVRSRLNASRVPFDPVLRMALIDAGVITVEQLQEAEKKIAVFTQHVTQPAFRGESNADS